MKLSDVVASKNEAWVDYEEGVEGGARFLLAYSQIGEPENWLEKQQNKLRRNSRGGIILQKKINALTLDLLVEAIVKDWKGWTDEVDGKEIEFPYSKENCRKMLTQSPVIRDWVANQAANIENFGGNLNPDIEKEEDSANGKMKSEPPVASKP